MKKNIFIFLVFFVSAIVFFSCSKDDDNNPGNEYPDVKVRYEATVSDPGSFKINVNYMDENGSPLKSVTVESPFKYEMTVKEGAYLYISVRPESKTEIIPDTEKTVTCKMYINDKLHEEATNKDAAIVQYIYGTPKE